MSKPLLLTSLLYLQVPLISIIIFTYLLCMIFYHVDSQQQKNEATRTSHFVMSQTASPYDSNPLLATPILLTDTTAQPSPLLSPLLSSSFFSLSSLSSLIPHAKTIRYPAGRYCFPSDADTSLLKTDVHPVYYAELEACVRLDVTDRIMPKFDVRTC